MDSSDFLHWAVSISQHGTLQQIMNKVSSLYMTHLAVKEPNNFQQVSKLIELNTISIT